MEIRIVLGRDEPLMDGQLAFHNYSILFLIDPDGQFTHLVLDLFFTRRCLWFQTILGNDSCRVMFVYDSWQEQVRFSPAVKMPIT